jgi:hypothetical protein
MVWLLLAPPTIAPICSVTFDTTTSSSGADGRPNIQSMPPSGSAINPSSVTVAWMITFAISSSSS